jgi:hypothetical protein
MNKQHVVHFSLYTARQIQDLRQIREQTQAYMCEEAVTRAFLEEFRIYAYQTALIYPLGFRRQPGRASKTTIRLSGVTARRLEELMYLHRLSKAEALEWVIDRLWHEEWPARWRSASPVLEVNDLIAHTCPETGLASLIRYLGNRKGRIIEHATQSGMVVWVPTLVIQAEGTSLRGVWWTLPADHVLKEAV